VIFATLEEYLPLSDLLKIVVVCVGVAIISPAAAALVITGFETQANAHQAGGSRLAGDLRIALGVAVIAVMIAVGIYALINA
jgi:hypothetical protein